MIEGVGGTTGVTLSSCALKIGNLTDDTIMHACYYLALIYAGPPFCQAGCSSEWYICLGHACYQFAEASASCTEAAGRLPGEKVKMYENATN